MKLIVTRIGVKREKQNRNRPSARLRTKVLTVLTGTALTLTVCLLAEKLQGQSLPVSVNVQQKDGFLLPVVCYEDTDALLLTEDLMMFSEAGYETVTCLEVVSMARGMSEVPEKPLLILFCGSGREIFAEYLPVLEKQNAKGCAVIYGSDADLYSGSVPKTGEAGLSWNEIRSLEKSGRIETVSGGYALCHEKGKISPRDLADDLLTMQTRMNEELYHDASVFCFPSGEEDDRSEAVLRELGFLMALTEGEDVGSIDGTDDLFDVEYIRRGEDPAAEFFERIGRDDPA